MAGFVAQRNFILGGPLVQLLTNEVMTAKQCLCEEEPLVIALSVLLIMSTERGIPAGFQNETGLLRNSVPFVRGCWLYELRYI